MEHRGEEVVDQETKQIQKKYSTWWALPRRGYTFQNSLKKKQQLRHNRQKR